MSKKKKKPWAENGLEDWGSYMAAKKEKLEEQFEEAALKEFDDRTSLFRGIAIFVNGYTNPCADDLKRLMMAHGGIYHHYMRSQITTHIIASNLPYSKIVAYRKSQNPLPICKPEWITDSLKAQKLLDWRPYVLYSNSTVTQPQLKFTGKPVGSLLSAGPENTSRSASCSVVQNSESAEAPKIHSIKNSVKSHENSEVSSDIKSNSGPLSTKNSEFLSEFYNNSRLHHISTMGATFKDYVNELRTKNGTTFPGLERLKTLPKNTVPCSSVQNGSDSEEDLFEPSPVELIKLGKDPVIMHIDMDCFFVSVGLKNRPELKGFPVAVTHAKGNKQTSKNDDSGGEEDYGSMSEIASCSYEARKAGLKNGMFLGQALKLCPNLKTIKYDFEGYKQVSYILYSTVASYTLNIEAVSCDEMYADITAVLKQSQLTPLQFATVIREEIKAKTGCPVSTGFGTNKLQARLATRKAKPDGQFYLESSKAQEYIGSMVVRDLPGVGSSTTHLLHQMNVRTCSDLQSVALGVLQKEFGKKTGELLHNMCRGVDNSKLNLEHVRKSVSAEVNYGIRFENGNDAEQFLRQLSQEVSSRLQKANAKGRSVTLKLMIRARDAPKEAIKFMGHGVCDNFTKSKNLIAPIDDPAIITKEVLLLWNQMQQLPEDVRGVGIQIGRLESLKSRSGCGNMMNFISKAKQSDSEEVPKVPQNSTDIVQSSINVDLSGIDSNQKICPKNSLNKEPKSRGLKAFLVPKGQLSSKHNGFVNPDDKGSSETTGIDEIDESVLAQLPADIRMEILKSRGDCRATGCADLQLTSSKVPDMDRDISFAGPPRSNHKEKRFGCQSSLAADVALPMENIDKSVLAQLPVDIRMEILKSRSDSRNSSSHPNAQHSTTNAPVFDGDAPLAVPLRLNDEEKRLNLESSSSADEPLPLENIDKSVLAQLPVDIRMEILKSRSHCRVSSNHLNVQASTSNAPDFDGDAPLAVPLRLNDEEKRLNLESSSSADEPSPLENIDKSVLAQLPVDIRMEILKSRSNCRVSSNHSNAQASTSRAPDFGSDASLVVPLRLNDEEKRSNSEPSLSADESSPLENIDESVLKELPEDIRNEILGSKKTANVIMNKEPERSTKSRQTQQENFFKHKKSYSGKSGKAIMPAIEEIDMSVLIELPEDIRNEIINDYKAKKQAKLNDIASSERVDNRETERQRNNHTNDKKDIVEDANVSFSQVDPEFLAALSEDMKTDVEMYCMIKKKEKRSKLNNLIEMKPQVSNFTTKNRTTSKQNKKNVLPTKSKNNKKTNTAKGISIDRRNVEKSPEPAKKVAPTKSDETIERCNDNGYTSGRFLESDITVDQTAGTSLKQRQEIISHHSSLIGNETKSDDQEMLTNLVNYLFTVPVQQVKMQIQTWISKSDDVNEIDLLSLATFLSMLPKKKRLEELHILLKTMHRCITRTGSCVWHGTYRKTVDHVQRYMQIEYNSNLMLPRIECDCRVYEK